MLTLNIVTGLAMMVLTIIIHSVFMVVGAKIAKWRRSHFGNIRKETAKAVLLSGLTIWLFLAIVIEAGLWAMLYLLNPLITALAGSGNRLLFLHGDIHDTGFRRCGAHRSVADAGRPSRQPTG